MYWCVERSLKRSGAARTYVVRQINSREISLHDATIAIEQLDSKTNGANRPVLLCSPLGTAVVRHNDGCEDWFTHFRVLLQLLDMDRGKESGPVPSAFGGLGGNDERMLLNWNLQQSHKTHSKRFLKKNRLFPQAKYLQQRALKFLDCAPRPLCAR